MSERTLKNENKTLVLKLLGVIVMMSLFAYALVPLYNVFCDVTGINGKTRGQALYQGVNVDKDRLITVEFLTNVNRGLPWDFKPLVRSIKVHPGELTEVHFYAKNHSKLDIIGQAIPSISPGEAALYMNKTECFCFDQTPLNAGQELEMPVKFFLDPDLPKDITTLTLSYQMFNVTEAAKATAASTK